MKTTFTPQYIRDNQGCYSEEPGKVDRLPFINKESITLRDLFDGLPIKDFTWFLAKKTELTNTQKVALAIHCAEHVVPIYEKKYPTDMRVRDCVQATKDFVAGLITREVLMDKRSAAYAAYADAADAAAAAADAADADAAYAAYAYAAAYAAAAAADAADVRAAYRAHVWAFVESILKSQGEE